MKNHNVLTTKWRDGGWKKMVPDSTKFTLNGNRKGELYPGVYSTKLLKRERPMHTSSILYNILSFYNYFFIHFSLPLFIMLLNYYYYLNVMLHIPLWLYITRQSELVQYTPSYVVKNMRHQYVMTFHNNTCIYNFLYSKLIL